MSFGAVMAICSPKRNISRSSGPFGLVSLDRRSARMPPEWQENGRFPGHSRKKIGYRRSGILTCTRYAASRNPVRSEMPGKLPVLAYGVRGTAYDNCGTMLWHIRSTHHKAWKTALTGWLDVLECMTPELPCGGSLTHGAACCIVVRLSEGSADRHPWRGGWVIFHSECRWICRTT